MGSLWKKNMHLPASGILLLQIDCAAWLSICPPTPLLLIFCLRLSICSVESSFQKQSHQQTEGKVLLFSLASAGKFLVMRGSFLCLHRKRDFNNPRMSIVLTMNMAFLTVFDTFVTCILIPENSPLIYLVHLYIILSAKKC